MTIGVTELAETADAFARSVPAEPHLRYQVGLPRAGRWREVINTDAFTYGGSGVGNQGFIEAVPEPSHGQPASAVFAVPPLGALWLVPED